MNKIALVTGSSRGIGRHIALKLAEQGYKVVVTGRQNETVQSTVNEILQAGGHAWPLVADLSTDAGLASAQNLLKEKTNSKLDLLICNIGQGGAVNGIQIDLNEWKKVFEINFFSTVMAFNAFYPNLLATQGHVVCISSIAGVEKLFLTPTYSVAKAAVISFVQQMMRPLAENKMRINCISPGMVWTENGSWDRKLKSQPDWVNSILKEQVALQKFVPADEIAEAVLFLDRTSSLTGQNIVIDAGHTRQT